MRLCVMGHVDIGGPSDLERNIPVEQSGWSSASWWDKY